MNEVGKLIQRRRKELGLTLEDVGKAVGVGRSTVQRWESGLIKNMGRDKIALLAKVLQISPVKIVPVFIEISDEKPEPPREKTQDEERLEALHQDPRLCLLFDRSRKMSASDIEFMLQMADRILGERGEG